MVGLIVVEVVVLLSFGIWPTTRRGWILLLVLGPPAYLLAEWVSDLVFERVEKLGGGSSSVLSWRRVLVALIAFLVLISLVVPVLWAAGVDLGK